MKNFLEELEKMIGKQFDEDDIIVTYETEEEVIVSEIEGQESNFEGHGTCKCYNVYENIEGSEIFTLYVDEDNEIVSVN